MDLIHTVRAMQSLADEHRSAEQTLALVPTMGALHEGHLELVEVARRHADHVTVSIFVNPTQFGPDEDFDRYPRQLEVDWKALEARGGVDVIFAPVLEELYPDGQAAQRTWVEVEQMDKHLCGRHRPGHFRGVTTVVSKLFHCCRPHIAVFGRKDAQQFIILQRMVRDLNFGIELVGVPIVREADGLALSSRNVYLTPDERRQAMVLSLAVEAARERILGGEQQAKALVETMRQTIAQAPNARIQYTEVVDAATLQPLDTLVPGQEALAAVAVYFGATRLIDNVFVRVPQPD
jgi:pantoate--beta-alanine ligase